MDAPIFIESQRFNQRWLLWPLAVVNLVAFAGAASSPWWLHQVPEAPPQWFVWLGFAVFVIVTLTIITAELRTRIDATGIHVRWRPFHRTYRTYPWTSLQEVAVRTYSPIVEYGGWGVRYSITGKGMAYNVSGDQGLQLVLQNGKKILIGTQEPQRIAEVVDYYKS
jgi:hypothetical protein